MKHTATAADPIVLECDLEQSPELVWRALTERDLLAAWLLPNDLRPEVGARFSFAPADQRSGDSIECEVLAVEPERTLKWRQTERGDAGSGRQPVTSVVTIELTDHADGGTHFRLVHDEFAVAPAAADAPLAAPAQACATVIAVNFSDQPSRPRVASMPRRTDIVCQLRKAA